MENVLIGLVGKKIKNGFIGIASLNINEFKLVTDCDGEETEYPKLGASTEKGYFSRKPCIIDVYVLRVDDEEIFISDVSANYIIENLSGHKLFVTRGLKANPHIDIANYLQPDARG